MFDNYRQLIAKIDHRANAIQQQWGRHMDCRRGCDSCCRHITVFPVEAAFLAAALKQAPFDRAAGIRESARRAAPDGPCPLLKNGACQLYAARPIICRTQGLPLLVNQHGKTTVDTCPRNFNDVRQLPADIVIDLDRLNHMLTAVNFHFVSAWMSHQTNPERRLIATALTADIPLRNDIECG